MNPKLREGAAETADQLNQSSERECERGLAVAKASGFSLEIAPPDQRSRVRYPIRLEVEYRVLNGSKVVHTGFGKTHNISSGGILFEAKGPLPADGFVELAINWPFLLEGTCHLKLFVRGVIVRSDTTGTAVKVTRHEFRTCKRPAI